MNLAQQIRAWRALRRNEGQSISPDGTDVGAILQRCRYVFNIAQIDNGFLVFYTSNAPNKSALTNTYGGPVGPDNTNIRYCKDVNELPDILTGLTAQLRLNL